MGLQPTTYSGQSFVKTLPTKRQIQRQRQGQRQRQIQRAALDNRVCLNTKYCIICFPLQTMKLLGDCYQIKANPVD